MCHGLSAMGQVPCGKEGEWLGWGRGRDALADPAVREAHTQSAHRGEGDALREAGGGRTGCGPLPGAGGVKGPKVSGSGWGH